MAAKGRALTLIGLKCICLSVLWMTAIPAMAGKLDKFEESATTRSSGGQSSSGSGSGSGGDSGLGDDLAVALLRPVVRLMVEATIAVLAYGQEGSQQKSDERWDGQLPEGGEPSSAFAIPLLRADINSASGTDIYWNDLRLEGGYGSASVFYRNSLYGEYDADDHMRIQQKGILYRLFYGGRLELHLGLGSYRLSGNAEYNDIALYSGLNFQLRNKLWIDVHRASVIGWNLSLGDTEVAFVYGEQSLFGRLGYRRLNADGVVLDGLSLGLTLLY